MTPHIAVLAGTAASLGFLHTVLGPDHYLPFIAMARSGRWSLRKTALVTLMSGFGHVASSVVLGTVGIALGTAVARLEALEARRGTIAAWLLIAFGLTYCAWGLHRARRQGPRGHAHLHLAGIAHRHGREPAHDHDHAADGRAAGPAPAPEASEARSMTPWILFAVFVFGPCEPLIPLLMVPAAQSSRAGVMLVAGIFGAVTITTMLAIVLLSSYGLRLVPAARLERYAHAIAGFTIFLCGVGIQALGL